MRSLGVTEVVRATVPEWLEPTFRVLAVFGDLPVVVATLGVVYLLAVRAGGKTDRGLLCSDRTAAFLATALGGLALVVLLKYSFALPRPPAELQAVPRDGYGFPSGHTMAATILWVGLARWYGRLGRNAAGVAATLVVVVASSRLVLGVHYFVDVVASIAFGVAYLLVMIRIARDDPRRAFGVAVAIGFGAVIVSGVSTDGLLALVGTVGGFVGWWTVERPAVRRQVRRIVPWDTVR